MASLWTFAFLLGSLFVFGHACPNIITRAGWGGRPPRGTAATLAAPTPIVVIHHGGTNTFCTTQAQCASIMRAYQNFHMDNNGWLDIGYNFCVGEDGNVYEGRGWTRVGAHAVNWNARSVGICFIGDFTSRAPNQAALNAARSLIQCGVQNGRIAVNHRLTSHRNVGATACPGNALFNVLTSWPNWTTNPRNYEEPLPYLMQILQEEP